MKSNRLFLVSSGITESGIVVNHWRMGVRAVMEAMLIAINMLYAIRFILQFFSLRLLD